MNSNFEETLITEKVGSGDIKLIKQILHSEIKPCKTSFTNLKLLEDELYIFDKLMYKNKNQHRTSMFYQKLQETRKKIKKIQALKLTEFSKFLSQLLIHNKKNKEIHLPSSYCIEFTLNLSNSVREIINLILKSSEYLKIQLGVGHFVPFSLSMFSICARLYVFMVDLYNSCANIYNCIGFKISTVLKKYNTVYCFSNQEIQELSTLYKEKPDTTIDNFPITPQEEEDIGEKVISMEF